MVTVRLSIVFSIIVFALPASAGGALKVVDVGVLSPVLGAGGKSKVKVLVRNTGRKAVRGGVVRFKLAGKGGRPLTGAAKVGRVKARRAKTITGFVAIPQNLRPGMHAIVACLKTACAKRAEPIGVQPKPAADSLGRLKVTPRIAEGGTPREGVISKDGGALSAIGADNRFYTLVVPPGALASDERISISPLAAVEGMPFAAGLLAGVQLEPAGLEFARPAALIISGDGLQPAAGQAAFAYDADGRDFRLSAWFLKVPDFVQGYYDPSKSLVIPVEHFSGIGVAPATDLETARQLRYDAGAARDRISQEIAEKIGKERDRQLRGEEATDLSELTEASLDAFLEQVILPEAAAASFSDAMYESAVRDFIGWERQRQLLGASEGPPPAKYKALIDRINQLLKIAWEKLVERAEKRCYAGDFSIITRILPLERQRELLGDGGRPNEFTKGLQRCWKFELRVTSRVEHKGSGGPQGFSGSVDETYELTGTIPLGLDGGGTLDILSADIRGTGPFTYRIATHTASGTIDFGFAKNTCQMASTGQTMPGQITVAQGNLGYQITGSDVKRIVPPFLTLDVGDPQEEINSKCQGSFGNQPYSSDENQWERNFLRYWAVVHGDERSNADSSSQQAGAPNPGPWRLEFEQKPWPMLGRYTLDESDETYGYRVTEVWELVHTPPKKGRR